MHFFTENSLQSNVPSLVPGIRDAGILLAAFGDHDPGDASVLDAHLRKGVLSFADNSSRI